MHIISKLIIAAFCEKNAQFKERVLAWYSLVETLNWRKPMDIIETFGPKAVDTLGNWEGKASDRVVFDLGGNNIRVIAKYVFHTKLKRCRLYIKWIGTHAEYDKLCKNDLQYIVDQSK